jgi:hypothetical protein
MSDRRNGEVEIVSGIAAENEISQERSHGRNQFLGCFSATLARAIQQKRTYSLGVPPADIFTKCMEQFSRATAVIPESPLGNATMYMKPVAECGHQCGLIVPNFIVLMVPAHPALNQMPVKELYSAAWVKAGPFVVGLRATTMLKVSDKRIQQAPIHICQGASFALHKTAEMGCGTQIANRSRMSVALFFKCAREIIYMASTDTRTQTSERF